MPQQPSVAFPRIGFLLAFLGGAALVSFSSDHLSPISSGSSSLLGKQRDRGSCPPTGTRSFVDRPPRPCPGASPTDHEDFIHGPTCECAPDQFGFDKWTNACMCQFPVTSVDMGCTPVPVHDDEVPGILLGIHAVKQIVSNGLYNRFPGWVDGSVYPSDGCTAITMVGQRRLNSLHWLLEDAIARGVPGGFIETGVWRGGACMVAATIFRLYGQKGRTVFLADSFRGIPPVDTEKFPQDAPHAGSHLVPVLMQNSYEAVKESFHHLNLLDNPDYPIEFLVGYFNETLPAADKAGKFDGGFAVIRLDGDIYESTWQALVTLYPRLSPGGYVIIDDYFDWIGCHEAVNDFIVKTPGLLGTTVVPAYHDFSNAEDPEKKRGAWFRKPMAGTA